MTPTATQGTDRVVKSIGVTLGAGANQILVAAQPGVVYRAVSGQISMDANGNYAIYHGAAFASAKTIALGYVAANGGSNPEPGDWADQAGVANEDIRTDIVGGNAKIALFYIEIRVLG